MEVSCSSQLYPNITPLPKKLMQRDLPDFFPHQVRRSALVLFVQALCQIWPGLECIWGDITEGGFYFDFHLSHTPPPDFTHRTECAFESNVKLQKSLRLVQRMKDNAVDWFALKNQTHRANLIGDQKESIIQLAVWNEFLEPCSGEIAKQVPPLELCLHGPSPIERGLYSQHQRAWRLQGQLFSSKQTKARYVKLKRKLISKQQTHQQRGQFLNLFFSNPEKKGPLIWMRRGLAMRHRLKKWWTALQRKNGVEIFSEFQISPHPKQSRVCDGTHFPPAFDRVLEKKGFESFSFGSWQLIDSECQPGQLEGLFAQKYYWEDQTFVFCAKEQKLLKFKIALELIELASQPFGFESAWSITLPHSTESVLSNNENWTKEVFAGLNQSVTIQKSAGQIHVQAQLMAKDGQGRWWSIGSALLRQQPKRARSKVDETEFYARWNLCYSLMGNLERYLALILELPWQQLPTWFIASSLSIATCANRREIKSLEADFAKYGVDAHFRFCSDVDAMQSEIKRALQSGEIHVASLYFDQIGTHHMQLHSASSEGSHHINPADYAVLSEKSFTAALMNDTTKARVKT